VGAAAAAALAAAAAAHLPLSAGAPLPPRPRLALGAAWAAVPDVTLLLSGPACVWDGKSNAALLPHLDGAALEPAAGLTVLPARVTCLQLQCA